MLGRSLDAEEGAPAGTVFETVSVEEGSLPQPTVDNITETETIDAKNLIVEAPHRNQWKLIKMSRGNVLYEL